MSVQKSITQQFEVRAKTAYVEAESKPEQGYYFFAYRMMIKNSGNSPAQLVSRHWVITDGQGQIEEVRGPGVVGLQPHIQPGQVFEYESACPLSSSSGSMKGHYEMISESGEKFTIEIPEFYLVAPHALH